MLSDISLKKGIQQRILHSRKHDVILFLHTFRQSGILVGEGIRKQAQFQRALPFLEIPIIERTRQKDDPVARVTMVEHLKLSILLEEIDDTGNDMLVVHRFIPVSAIGDETERIFPRSEERHMNMETVGDFIKRRKRHHGDIQTPGYFILPFIYDGLGIVLSGSVPACHDLLQFHRPVYSSFFNKRSSDRRQAS